MASKRAQELADELLRMESRLSAPMRTSAGHSASSHYSGPGLAEGKAWLKAKYAKNPKLFMIGGAVLAVALLTVIGVVAYRKKKESQSE